MQELVTFSNFSGINTVPVLGTGKISDFKDLDEIIKFADGDSVFKNNNKPVPREGVVWRTKDGKVHFKNKSRQYKVFFEKKTVE